MKLGLANLVIFAALYLLDFRAACVISVVRMLLVAFTFSNTFSLLYSLGGGILSLLVMGALKKSRIFSGIGISVAGAAAHNIGQIIVAAAVLGSAGVFGYLPVLLVTGCVTGALIGLLGGMVVERIPKRLEGKL
jgi:heptaprenyl diphosphate synthase